MLEEENPPSPLVSSHSSFLAWVTSWQTLWSMRIMRGPRLVAPRPQHAIRLLRSAEAALLRYPSHRSDDLRQRPIRHPRGNTRRTRPSPSNADHSDTEHSRR